MPDISRKDVACLLNMLDAIQRIQLYSGKFSDADSFYHDGFSFDVTLMNFVVIPNRLDFIHKIIVTGVYEIASLVATFQQVKPLGTIFVPRTE